MGHDVAAMEDYVAADKRPLKKCLEDIDNCDALVGIVAWRYGYRPQDEKNPQNYSITELEIRHARDKGKACLCFLLVDKESWAPGMIDDGEDRESVLALRKYLQDKRVVSYFRDSNNLAKLVDKAIRQEFSVRDLGIKKLPPEMFERELLKEKDYRDITIEKLYPMVTRTNFMPELIVGINEGGTLVAAVLTRQYESVPMGIAHTEKIAFDRKKEIAYFSLPRRFRQALAGNRAADIKVNQILVVDAKFKSGSSVLAVDSLLRKKYGKKCDIRYGFIIAYGVLDPARLKPVKPGQPWYIQIPVGSITGYVAYYTPIDPGQGIDPILEEVRH